MVWGRWEGPDQDDRQKATCKQDKPWYFATNWVWERIRGRSNLSVSVKGDYDTMTPTSGKRGGIQQRRQKALPTKSVWKLDCLEKAIRAGHADLCRS